MNAPVTETQQPSMRLILDVVADEFSMPRLDLISDRRDARTALARSVAMYCAHQLTTLSQTEIGKQIGGRSASAVCHGITRITAKTSLHPEFNDRVLGLLDALIRPAPFDVVAGGPAPVEPVQIMSGFYVGFTTGRGNREHFRSVFSQGMAEDMARKLPGHHVVIPAERLEAWKAGA